jgi:hypothetical protein
MRDRETIDAELRLVAALRQAATERAGLLPSIAVADVKPTASFLLVVGTKVITRRLAVSLLS